MRVLGIDSSGLVASAAIADGENLLAEFTVNNKQTHSQTLLPMIDNVVKMSGVSLSDIDVIAISSGPGSFTGLRIGSSTAKGLGFALGKKIVDVPTLEGLAFRFAGSNELICPMMDARRCQVYSGLYDVSGKKTEKEFNGKREKTVLPVNPIIAQDALAVEEMVNKVNEAEGPVIFMGDGVFVYHDLIEEKIKVPYRFAPIHLARQSAAAVAALGYIYAKQGRACEAWNHKPKYLRKSQAERERERINVCKMQKKDLDLILGLEGNCFTKPWKMEDFNDFLGDKDKICLVAKKLGEVIGYCVIQVCFETAELCRIGVMPEMRRQGAGVLMLEEGKKLLAARNVEKFMLEVRSSNEAAINLYKKNDFKEIGKRKDYYSKPIEDAVIMECCHAFPVYKQLNS